MYSCVPTGIQLYTPAFNVVTFYFTETFPQCNCRSAVNDSAGGSFSQLHWQHGGSSRLAGFRVEFSEFCAILRADSLSLLVLLVDLNLVRIRLLPNVDKNAGKRDFTLKVR